MYYPCKDTENIIQNKGYTFIRRMLVAVKWLLKKDRRDVATHEMEILKLSNDHPNIVRTYGMD